MYMCLLGFRVGSSIPTIVFATFQPCSLAISVGLKIVHARGSVIVVLIHAFKAGFRGAVTRIYKLGRFLALELLFVV